MDSTQYRGIVLTSSLIEKWANFLTDAAEEANIALSHHEAVLMAAFLVSNAEDRGLRD